MRGSAGWAVAAWLLFVLACIIVISRTEFNADLSAFLPRSPTPAQRILVDQLRDGVVSRLILIGIEGPAPEAIAKTSTQLAAELRKDERFVSVNNGEEIGLERDRDFLWRNRYLLSPAMMPEHFSVSALRESLEDDLQMLTSPVGMMVRRILPNDPTGELVRLVGEFEGQAKPVMQEGVWFSKDGKRALLYAQTKATGSDIDAQEVALGAIRSAFDRTATAHQSRLLLSGPGVFSVNSRESIKGDASRFSMIATVLIAVMLLALYRSPRVLALGFLPVATGSLAGIAAVSLDFGSVHGITLGFGVTLIGECVDYAIYLFTQTAPGVKPRDTFNRIWPTLRLGVLTSICGFGAMLFSGFPGLAQLGLFSIVGLVVAVAVARWVLPALLPDGFFARAPTALAPKIMNAIRWAPVLRYPLLLAVALAALFLVMHRDSLWSSELSSLSPISKSDQLLDEQLRRDIGAPDVRHLVVIKARDEETALQATEKITNTLQRLSQQGVLQSFDSPTTYLPSRETQRARQAAIPALPVLQENLQQAVKGLPFREDLFAPFLKDIEAAKNQPLVDRTALQGTNLGLKVDSLLLKRSDGWIAMLSLRGVSNPEAIAKEIASSPDAEVVFLDLRQETNHLYETYRQEAVHYSLLGAAAIIVLLFASLRSIRRVLEVLAPLAAAVVVTAALVAASTQLSIFHLVGLLLVVAIGSNYALFFDRHASSADEKERTMVSLLFANVATVIGFGLLSFSQAPVLHAIGLTVGLGAILSLVFSAILIKRGQ